MTDEHLVKIALMIAMISLSTSIAGLIIVCSR